MHIKINHLCLYINHHTTNSGTISVCPVIIYMNLKREYRDHNKK